MLCDCGIYWHCGLFRKCMSILLSVFFLNEFHFVMYSCVHVCGASGDKGGVLIE